MGQAGQVGAGGSGRGTRVRSGHADPLDGTLNPFSAHVNPIGGAWAPVPTLHLKG